MVSGGIRELLILRHAKSAWDTDAPTDFERPLGPRGVRDAPLMGLWLRDLLPDRVVSSSALRAKQTVEALLDAAGLDADEVVWEERVYEAGLGDLLEVLSEHAPAARRLLIVGHNPGLESLVFRLGGGQVNIPPNGKIMPTAAVAHFRLPDDWGGFGPGAGELVEIARPRELRS